MQYLREMGGEEFKSDEDEFEFEGGMALHYLRMSKNSL